jgi:hypothetical protein
VATTGRRWTVNDRSGNVIYITEERWAHIVDDDNHPEVSAYEDLVQETLRRGRRRQEPLNPRKYRYVYEFDELPDDFNHIVVIVLFGFTVDERGRSQSNNYVATAYFKHI